MPRRRRFGAGRTPWESGRRVVLGLKEAKISSGVTGARVAAADWVEEVEETDGLDIVVRSPTDCKSGRTFDFQKRF